MRFYYEIRGNAQWVFDRQTKRWYGPFDSFGTARKFLRDLRKSIGA